MSDKREGVTMNDRELLGLIHPLRFLDNRRNLFYLAFDYCVLAFVFILTITICQHRGQWDVPWWVLGMIVAGAFVLIGACQHRLAGLGHEGAHYILLTNRVANEL